MYINPMTNKDIKVIIKMMKKMEELQELHDSLSPEVQNMKSTDTELKGLTWFGPLNQMLKKYVQYIKKME